jgi:hypothetical protein
MTDRFEITFTGPAPLVGYVIQELTEAGGEVDYDGGNRLEERSTEAIAVEVIKFTVENLAWTAVVAVGKRVIGHVRRIRLQVDDVEIEPDDPPHDAQPE